MAIGKYKKWLEKENLILLEGWARDGLTDEQIAERMGIQRPTLYDWKNKYADISDALKKGKEVIDYQVENALLQKALDGDTTAQIFWLKNRKAKTWRDKQETQITGDMNIKQENSLKDLTFEQLKELAAERNKGAKNG